VDTVKCRKSDNPSNSEKISKRFFSSTVNAINNSFEDLTFNDIPTAIHDLPDVINTFLINITSPIPVIDTIKLDEIR